MNSLSSFLHGSFTLTLAHVEKIICLFPQWAEVLPAEYWSISEASDSFGIVSNHVNLFLFPSDLKINN